MKREGGDGKYKVLPLTINSLVSILISELLTMEEGTLKGY